MGKDTYFLTTHTIIRHVNKIKDADSVEVVQIGNPIYEFIKNSIPGNFDNRFVWDLKSKHLLLITDSGRKLRCESADIPYMYKTIFKKTEPITYVVLYRFWDYTEVMYVGENKEKALE